jgi:hypothetical protein
MESLKSAEDIIFHSHEQDLLDRVIAYVIAVDKQTYQRQVYRLHLDVPDDQEHIVLAARESIDKHSTLSAVIWTDKNNKKRMWIYDGDILLTDLDEIKQMWTEMSPKETEEEKETQRYHSALHTPNN